MSTNVRPVRLDNFHTILAKRQYLIARAILESVRPEEVVSQPVVGALLRILETKQLVLPFFKEMVAVKLRKNLRIEDTYLLLRDHSPETTLIRHVVGSTRVNDYLHRSLQDALVSVIKKRRDLDLNARDVEDASLVQRQQHLMQVAQSIIDRVFDSADQVPILVCQLCAELATALYHVDGKESFKSGQSHARTASAEATISSNTTNKDGKEPLEPDDPGKLSSAQASSSHEDQKTSRPTSPLASFKSNEADLKRSSTSDSITRTRSRTQSSASSEASDEDGTIVDRQRFAIRRRRHNRSKSKSGALRGLAGIHQDEIQAFHLGKSLDAGTLASMTSTLSKTNGNGDLHIPPSSGERSHSISPQRKNTTHGETRASFDHPLAASTDQHVESHNHILSRSAQRRSLVARSEMQVDSECQAVASILFLRCICPAIVCPTCIPAKHATKIGSRARKTFSLVARMIQGLANRSQFSNILEPMQPFYERNEKLYRKFSRSIVMRGVHASPRGRAEDGKLESEFSGESMRLDMDWDILFAYIRSRQSVLATLIAKLAPDRLSAAVTTQSLNSLTLDAGSSPTSSVHSGGSSGDEIYRRLYKSGESSDDGKSNFELRQAHSTGELPDHPKGGKASPSNSKNSVVSRPSRSVSDNSHAVVKSHVK